MRLRVSAAAVAAAAALAVALSGCGTATATDPASDRIGSTPIPVPSAKAPAPAARTPAREQIPAAAEAVTISLNLGRNQGGRKPPKPVTITDRATVRQLTALINDLPPFPPGSFSCPADFGSDLVLTFRAAAESPALAVATLDLAGCGGVNLTIGGRPQPALAGPGTDSGPRILKTAGLSWKIPAR